MWLWMRGHALIERSGRGLNTSLVLSGELSLDLDYKSADTVLCRYQVGAAVQRMSDDLYALVPKPCLAFPRDELLLRWVLAPLSSLHRVNIDGDIPSFRNRKAIRNEPSLHFKLVHWRIETVESGAV